MGVKSKKGKIHFFYPWRFYLTWFFYYLWPSLKKHSSFKLAFRTTKSVDLNESKEVIKLMFFGDLMATKNGQAPKVDKVFLEKIKSTDFVIGNCECPLTSRHKGKHLFLFQMTSSFIKDFLHKFNLESEKLVLSIANNHMGDQGEEGFLDTKKVLNDLNVKIVGEYKKQSFPESSLTILEKNSYRIGVIAWTEWLNWRVFNEDHGILRKKEFLSINFKALKIKNKLDYLIVMPHWEFEFQHYPQKSNVDLAHQILNDEVDLIVGHHPHVLQPALEIKGKYCFFSLGNLNGPDFPIVSWPIKLGAFLEINLESSAEGSLKVSSYKLHPFYQEIKTDGVTLVPLDNLNKSLKIKVEKRLNGILPV